MTTTERLARARGRLRRLTILRAAVWTTLGGLLTLAALLALDLAFELGPATRTRLTPAPWLAAIATALWHLAGPIREAWSASDASIALWFERRLPQLQYALVTQVGLGAQPSAALELAVREAPLERELEATTRALLLRPALTLLLLGALLALLPVGAVGRVLAPAPGDALDRAGAGATAAADPLATIVVRVRPPSYTRLGTQTYEDPATVSALVGSRVSVEGRGRGVTLLRGGAPEVAEQAGDRWRVSLSVPERAEAFRLRGGGRERVIVIAPVPDSVPELRLERPARDTVLREARGRLDLAATARDDLGLAEAAFELIISAGSGELYTFRRLTVGQQAFAAGVTDGALRASLPLDSLQLKPGDLVHLRAIARDRNDIAGPGQGASETRSIRVARADEYDSVAVDPAPPSEPEKDALSQRMLLIQTQELVARRPRPSEALRLRESRRIAVDQAKLRKKVGEVVFLRLGEDASGEHEHFAGDGHQHAPEGTVNADAILAAAERAANQDPTRTLDTHGDETPIVAINRPLLEAYNHMWRATEELETGNPSAAIPWMERAIAALQRARAAERIYLRGRPPRVVVDLNRVRLAGKDEARPEARAARPPADPLRTARLARFDVALGLVARDAQAAADSLLLIRVALPPEERGAALALDAAASALRRGGEVTGALVAARRALVLDPPRRGALGAWGM